MNAKGSILLVDDDTHIARSIGDYLRANAYQVTLAHSAEEALRLVKAKSVPDLIILDVMMPGIGGLGFLREVERDGAGSPVSPIIVLTARASMAEFFDDSQVSGFLSKPCKGSDLLALVKRVMGGRVPQREIDTHKTRGRRRVLLGESDVAYSREIKDHLFLHAFDVTVVRTGIDVIDTAPTCRPQVILINDVLEGMNGRDVTPLLHAMPSTRNVPVLLYDFGNTLSRRQALATVAPPGVDHWISPAGISHIVEYACNRLGADFV